MELADLLVILAVIGTISAVVFWLVFAHIVMSRLDTINGNVERIVELFEFMTDRMEEEEK